MKLRDKISISKELAIGIVCLVVGAVSVSVNAYELSKGNELGLTGLPIGIMLLFFAWFWFNGGLTGHGSL